MSRWVPPPPLELQLWFGDLLVADLHDAFPHQGTWFATYELRISPGNGALHDRLLAYIAFSMDFNRGIAEGQDHDFEEFDVFSGVQEAGSWNIPRPDGGVMPMEGRMSFLDGQVSWQHPETPPSTEQAANELWARIAEYVSASGRGR